MARQILAGSLLNSISGESLRYPAFQVLVWNPRCTTFSQVATRTFVEVPKDITPYVEIIDYSENIGFENGDDPTTPQITLSLRRNPLTGEEFRRGWIDDGVIVQVRQGDIRVQKSDWVPIFTGTFRGRPGDNPGTPADLSEGLQATAYGREERYLNQVVTTEDFGQDIDVGVMLVHVAQVHMNLTQDEILIGAQGFESKHKITQLVEIPALQALWELLFPVKKKPKFDGEGRLRAVDVNLDKPALRVYSDGNTLIRSIIAAPNDVEVNNSVVIRGLDHNLTKIVQEAQLLTEFEAVTGFFDSEFKERIYYSQDRSQRAQETYLVTVKKIKWSNADWSEEDEFHGTVDIDTRYLRDARAIIFAVYLASQLTVATLDLLMQSGGTTVANTVIIPPIITVAIFREILYVLTLVALAALLWAMNFIGRGKYQVWGRPFEYVYQELIARHRLVGLEPEEVREIEFRNDLISTIEGLDDAAQERLRRELVKNQLFQIDLIDDPAIEVDDVIETSSGDRFYVVSVRKRIQRGQLPTMTLVCWQIASGKTNPIQALEPEA